MATVSAPNKLNVTPSADGQTQTISERERVSQYGLDWPVVFWLGLIHLGALAALFTFSWLGLALFFVLHWITGGIGVCLGYHRLLTHQSFSTYRPVRWLLAWIGGLSGEGDAIHWVATHRKHHALSDRPGDPHTPMDGSWWSHMIWCLYRDAPGQSDALHQRWAPDLMRDPALRFLRRTFLLWHIVFGVALFVCGRALGGVHLGVSLLTWGLFARLVFVLHSTWLVNSASHIWGYRNYKTTDDSRNNWWVALLTYGEGWHNNHHAYPRMARHGHRWWEIDTTFMSIRAMQRLGLAWDVVDGQHQRATSESGLAPESESNLDTTTPGTSAPGDSIEALNRQNHRPPRESDTRHRELSENDEVESDRVRKSYEASA